MAEIRIPTNRELMYPVLLAVQEAGGSATRDKIKELVPEIAGITPEQLAVVFPEGDRHSGKSKVLHRVDWAISDLGKVGVLDNPERGVWAITEKGRPYLAMERADAERSWQETRKRLPKGPPRKRKLEIVTEDPAENIVTGEDLDWPESLLTVLENMEPIAFEGLILQLLLKAGFSGLTGASQSGDGIEGVGVYKVSLVSFPVYLQCKRLRGSVGSGGVRDFRGAMTGRGDMGLFMTTGTFSSAARREATRDGAPPITLIDGESLCELLKEYRMGVAVEKRTVEDIAIHKDFFDKFGNRTR